MSRITRSLATFVVAATATTALAATPAAASPDVTVTWNVDAHTHLAKMGSDVTPPRGSFTGTIDLAGGNLTGNLALPPATITMYALGTVAAADASFAIEPVGPTTGHVDFASSHVTTTSTFDIRLAKVTPHPIPANVPAVQSLTQNANLVGSNCRTSKPISVTMSGTVDFVHGGTFSGNFSIPKFRDCQAMTAAINAIIPGDGNTFAATFSPPGTPAPSPAPGPAPAAFGLQAAAAVPPPTPAAPAPHAGVGVAGLLPVDVAPGAGTPVGTPPPPGGSGAAVQLPVKQPNPNGGLLGLLFGTG
jgi:hypothetical protein